jgi:hypothetical protein
LYEKRESFHSFAFTTREGVKSIDFRLLCLCNTLDFWDASFYKQFPRKGFATQFTLFG